MKKFWAAWLGLLALAACNLENQASDNGLEPGKSFGNTGNTLSVNAISAHACCETRPPAWTNDGGADWAVDGILTHWWHSNYNAGTPGYSVDTSESGHIDDPNYLRRGEGDRLDGYTWTSDPALAVDGPDYPIAVGDIVGPGTQNEYGAHWITLDLGREVEINAGTIGRLAYYRRADSAISGLGQPGVSYEIYVSKKDFGWLVDLPEVTLAKAEDEAEDPLPNAAGYSYIYLESETPLSFRYIQLRWVFDSTTGIVTADSRTASAANLVFKVFDRELDYSYLTAVYTRGMELIKTLPTTGHDYNNLRIALVNVQNRFEPPKEDAVDTVAKKTAYQNDVLDAAADSLLAAIYNIDPPKKPPEVQL
jgi:hypothetical protein